MLVRSSLLVAAAVTAPTPIPAPPLSPVSKWAIDYGNAGCKLTREFKDARGTAVGLSVAAQPLAPSWTMNVVEQTPGMRAAQRREGQVTIGGQTRSALVTTGSVASGMQSLSLEVPTSLLTEVAEPLVITVSPRSAGTTTYSVPGAAAGLAALRSCVRAEAADWGVDESANASVVTPAEPIGDERSWITAADYPSGEAAAGHQGNVVAVYSIANDGRVRECRVTISSKVDALDRAVCNALRAHARYRPARDAAGTPIIMQRVRFASFFAPES